MHAKQYKQQQVVRDHAAPGRNQIAAKHLCAQKGACNTDAPHAEYVKEKWSFCFSESLHHTLNDDRNTIEWL